MNEIKKNMPIPPPARAPRLTDAMRNMEVGDCITVDAKTAPCLRFMAKRKDWEIKTRKNGEGAFNIWRTK